MASVTSNSPKTLTIREAVDAIREGRLVVVPTETVFGIASAAGSKASVDTLWSLDAESGRQALAWHIESGARLTETLEGAGHRLSAVQRRLVEKLCPGPLLLAIELGPEAIGAVRSALGVEAGVLDDDGVLLVRVVANPEAQRMIADAGVALIMRAIPAGAGSARTTDEAARAIERLGISDKVAGVLESDSRPLGQGSTLVRFLSSGGYRVDREGAYAERYIDKQIMRTILFVCTGNTCRSPMASAIARELIEREPLELPTTVRSAGAFTSGGMPATPEAVAAVESLGYAMGPHQSSVLTREMIAQADEIYGLTASHVEAIRAIDPNAGDKVKLLDPDGRDVPDPIGQAQQVYDETAKRLRELIQKRLDAMRSHEKGGAAR